MGKTHPRVFHRSFWKFAYLFCMVCRCTCGFRVFLPLFFINFFYFFDLVFSRFDSIRTDTLWAQLLLEFSTDHFETMWTCSASSVNVHVVLGLLSFYFLSIFSDLLLIKFWKLLHELWLFITLGIFTLHTFCMLGFWNFIFRFLMKK